MKKAANDNAALRLDDIHSYYYDMKLQLQSAIYNGYLGQYSEQIDDGFQTHGLSLQEAVIDYRTRVISGDTAYLDGGYLELLGGSKSLFEGFKAIYEIECRADAYLEAFIKKYEPRNGLDTLRNFASKREALVAELMLNDASENWARGVLKVFERQWGEKFACEKPSEWNHPGRG